MRGYAAVISLRKCIGCGKRKEKKCLIRVVKTPENEDRGIFVCTHHTDGRGAYLCKNQECFERAKKFKKLEKSFSCKINSEVYDKLERMVSKSE